MSSTQGETEDGSDFGWSERVDDNRPIFIIGDEEIGRKTPIHVGFHVTLSVKIILNSGWHILILLLWQKSSTEK